MKHLEGKDASMRVNRPTIVGGNTAQRHRLVRPPPPVPEPGEIRFNHPIESRPLDWEHAVRAAAGRLSEKWVLSDTIRHPVMDGLARQLAALLCAYGMLPAEVERMETHADEPPAGTLSTLAHRWTMPGSRVPQPTALGLRRLFPMAMLHE
jgi:hypothetical protein